MQRSEELNELFTALALAQGESMAALKDSAGQVGQQRTKYADLSSCWDACREPLAKHNLSVAQVPSTEGTKVAVETILGHKSGQWISGTLTMTSSDPTPRGIGSTITYARRYSLCAMVGIAPEDDDGEAGSKGTKEAAQAVANKKLAAARESDERRKAEAIEREPEPEDDLVRQLEDSVKQTKTTKNFTMLEGFQNIKKELGDAEYYRILGDNGFEKSNQITDLKDGRRIYKAMGARLAEIRDEAAQAQEAALGV